jgi:hypothetical protein
MTAARAARLDAFGFAWELSAKKKPRTRSTGRWEAAVATAEVAMAARVLS